MHKPTTHTHSADLQNHWWDIIQSISQQACLFEGEIRHISVFVEDHIRVVINVDNQSEIPHLKIFLQDRSNGEVSSDTLCVWLENAIEAKLMNRMADQPWLREMLSYIPYALLGYQANKLQRAISISHFAQSLDGKIATNSGESRWIGNQENLIHAHRMRALCDGIIVGTGTLRNDKPSLTVRHVEGKHPTRIIIGNSCKEYESLFQSLDEKILIISSDPGEEMAGVDQIYLAAENNGRIAGKRMLEALYKEGVRSVYIEGGAYTTSAFLADKSIDIIQLHLSPQIFGSGLQAVSLEPISSVNQAMRFRKHLFSPVGDTIMFVGQPDYES